MIRLQASLTRREPQTAWMQISPFTTVTGGGSREMDLRSAVCYLPITSGTLQMVIPTPDVYTVPITSG